ncbi:MAG: aldehyde dehydrogenase family protein, partial [Pirellulaceae bacterium]|nr:aldehyde dehydrogenase family protein [Pirellulaceae bacterium]
AQRVIALDGVYNDLLDALKPRVEAIATGDPLKSGCKMGPMIRQGDAERVDAWIREAVEQGARLICGGERDNTLVQPTLVAEV